MNKRLLEAKMKLMGDTNATLAKFIGITPQSLSAKKNETHGKEFNKSEIAKIKERYSLTAEEINAIFFAEKVP